MTQDSSCCGHDHGLVDHPLAPTHDHHHDGHAHHHGHSHEKKHEHHDHHGHDHKHGHACSHDHSHAAPSASEKAVVPADAKRLRLHIADMDCPTEEALIRRTMTGMPHVLGLDFDLLNRILTVHHYQQEPAEIHAKLKALGMSGTELAEGEKAAAPATPS